MTDTKIESIEPFELNSYSFKTLQEEIRADQNCKVLLKELHQYLLKDGSISPIEAGSMARGADYFLRDFMIDNRRSNIFEISPELIQSFAGNWYIVSTLEPNMTELESILIGIRHFYRFCAKMKLINPAISEEIQQVCIQYEFYQQRIERFNDISGDGFTAWNSACPLP